MRYLVEWKVSNSLWIPVYSYEGYRSLKRAAKYCATAAMIFSPMPCRVKKITGKQVHFQGEVILTIVRPRSR